MAPTMNNRFAGGSSGTQSRHIASASTANISTINIPPARPSVSSKVAKAESL